MAYQKATIETCETDCQLDDGQAFRDELNREIEGILGRITHVFRSPLWALDGFASELLNRKARSLDPEAQTYLNHICSCGKRMNDLMQRLVEFRDEARALDEVRPVDISALVENELLSLVQQDTNRQVAIDIEPRLTATANPERLKTVVRHLLANAWKYTAVRPLARIEFGEDPAARDESPRMRTFYFRDNGVGYAPDMADRLFSPFERLHPASEYDGAGMGLANVRRIVHLHGGRVWCKSDGINGATFYFSLPE